MYKTVQLALLLLFYSVGFSGSDCNGISYMKKVCRSWPCICFRVHFYDISESSIAADLLFLF